MTKAPSHRRSPLISALVFILALAATLLLIALFQLDIGSYKQQLAGQLEQQLNKPVKLGDATLSFHGGIALDFRNLQVGEDAEFSLYIPQLSIILEPLELLSGRIVIEQVILDAPNLKLSLPIKLAKSGINLEQLGLKTLQIRKGTILISLPDDQPPLRIDNFNLVIHGVGKGLVSQLAVTATVLQNEQNTELHSFLELSRQYVGQPWRQGELRGNISLNNLQHNFFESLTTSEPLPQYNLRIGVQGVPAAKVLLESSLTDNSTEAPLFSLAADWQSAPSDDSFKNLRLGLAGVPLTGQLRLNRQGDESRLTGQIELASTRIKTLLAQTRINPTLAKLSGEIEKLSISLEGPLHPTAANPFSPLLSAYLKLNDLAYPVGVTNLTDTGLVVEIENAQFSLKEGHGLIAQTPFSFTGSASFPKQKTPVIDFSLESTLDLQLLRREFPSPFLSRQTLSGKVPLRLTLQGPTDFLSSALNIDLSQAEFSLGKLLEKERNIPSSIEIKAQLTPTDTGLVVEIENAQFSLKEGHGLIAQTPFSFTGSASFPKQKTPVIDFSLESTLDLQLLRREFPSPFLSRQTLSGKVPLRLTLQGPTDFLSSALNIDLSQAEFSLGKLLEKERNIPSSIEIKAQLTPTSLTIDKADFNIAKTNLQLSGGWSRKANSWSGAVQLAPLQLETLQAVSPIFNFFKIQGEAQGQFQSKETGGWEGEARLKHGGAHLTRVLSDLNHVNASLHLNPNGFDLGSIDARLGESAITVTGGLSNWKSPLLSLHVTGEEVRAQDLIFLNPQMTLQNLDGQLLISAGGIAFDSIHVMVENKTTAIVDGQMRGYRTPYTYLDISSENADILDVIKLFSGPDRNTQSSKAQNKAALEIKARVKQGELGSFSFTNAEATIIDRNKVFTVYPLDLNLAGGAASGRVEIDRNRNNLLKISGRAQRCDADSTYEMLFEKNGIFRGTLDGDFYLEGEEIGAKFWKTANGGGHLQITDGAMRELQGFAQIFSLLNVSQLFTFRLPDMDKEGLPFSRLATSSRISDGIIYFDDFSILSPAINISAVGTIDSPHATIDSTLGIKPLRTVDIILSRVPLFGWVLTGEEEALITALFTLKGPIENPKVGAAPVSSVTSTALGIIGRALGLPFRMLQKTGEFLTTPPRPNENADPKDTENND